MDDAELVVETLPWSQKRNTTGVANFAAFNHFRQEVHVRRTRNPTLTTGRPLKRHKKIAPEELPEVLFQTYI